MRKLSGLSAPVLAMLAVLAVAAAFALPSVASAAAGNSYSDVTAGTVSPAPAAPLAPVAPGISPRARSRAPRHAPRSGSSIITTAPSSRAAPSAAAPLGVKPLVNFNGVSSRDSAETNFGAEFEPPDQGLCAGNGFVVEMVNSAYRVYDTSGKSLAGPFNVNGPFDEGLLEFTSDPRCQYDAATNTWFAIILALNPTETGSTLDIAVNSSGDPRTKWTVYKINTTDTGGSSGPREPGCPCFGDQPRLGIDESNLYVTADDFSIKGEAFNGGEIYAFDKKALAALAPTVHFVRFPKLKVDNTRPLAPQPALSNGRAPAEYFLGSLDPSGTFDQRLAVWAMTNRTAVAKGEVPTLSNVVIGSEVYGVPPAAEQLSAGPTIESGDDRMQQAQFTGGSVWGELTTAITPEEGVQRAGAAWFQVRPALTAGVLSGARVVRQGYVTEPGGYVIYPALQITPEGAGAMVFTLTSATRHPSAAYSTLAPQGSAFGPPVIAQAGYGVYDPEGERWGDYSWAVLDPSGTAAWLATEYVPPKASQTPDGKHNWGTRVLEIAP
jgi:hypothetical protein